MMIVLAVVTNLPARSGYVWFLAEFTFDTIDDVYEALARDGVVRAERLELEDGRGPDRPIRSRSPVILGTAGIVMISPPRREAPKS